MAATDWASRVVPRFRERIVTPFLGAGTPHWALDPDFDLHYHVRRLRLPEGAGYRRPVHLRRAGRDDPARPVATAVGGDARRRPARRRGRAAGQAQPRALRRDGPRAAAGRAALAHPGADDRQAPAARADRGAREPVARSWCGRSAATSGWSAGPRAGCSASAASLVRPDRAVRDAARLRGLGEPGALAAARAAAAGARRAAARRGASARSTCRSPTCARRGRRRAGRSTTPTSPACSAASGATPRGAATRCRPTARCTLAFRRQVRPSPPRTAKPLSDRQNFRGI